MCFFNDGASCVHGDCKIICDAVDRAHIACFFRRKCASQESCRIPWVHFPCVFSGKIRLAFRSDCTFIWHASDRSRIPCLFSTKTCVAETLPDSMCFSMKVGLAFEVVVNLHVMRPAAPWCLILFQGKRASQEGFLREATTIANFHSYPSQEESQILTKEHCTGNVGLFDSQFLTNRGSLFWGKARLCDSHVFKTHVTPKGWDVKGGIPQNACWRLDVVKRGKRWNTIEPSQKRQPSKGPRAHERNAMKLSLACAQRSVAVWKRKH